MTPAERALLVQIVKNQKLIMKVLEMTEGTPMKYELSAAMDMTRDSLKFMAKETADEKRHIPVDTYTS